MARISYNQINKLPDTLDSNAFELLLGNIPNAGSTLDLTLKCQTATIGGVSNEVMESALHGHVRKLRGRKMYSRTLQVTYEEVSDMSTFRALKQWDEFIVGSNSGNSGGFRDQYSVTAQLIVYNPVGAIAGAFDYERMFIEDISEVSLDGQSSQAMPVSVTFSYDRMLMDGVPIL